MQRLHRLYDGYWAFRPFSEQEAWMLFRLAAVGEAIGWTLLVIGIACEQLPVSYNQVPVQIAGRIHGTLFLLYAVAVVVLAPSLGWGWRRTVIAGLASTPPYGSLMFEQIIGGGRSWREFRRLSGSVSYIMAVRLL